MILARIALAGFLLGAGLPVAADAKQPVAATESEMTIAGPQGLLAGTFLDSGRDQPVVLIIPGSGPTDRDGNNPLGVRAASYKRLADALAGQRISTLRIDKRGMFGSEAAVADANAVTVDDYVSDLRGWIKAVLHQKGKSCIWLAGHSEGGLVALAAAQNRQGICGVILLTAPGRPMGVILREQLAANPANAPILDDANSAIAALENGDQVDVSQMHPALQGLFNPAVQGFLIDIMAKDPAALAKSSESKLLIVGGGRDSQIGKADFDALVAARPDADKLMVANMTHVLSDATGEGAAAELATYTNANASISPDLVEAISAFIWR